VPLAQPSLFIQGATSLILEQVHARLGCWLRRRTPNAPVGPVNRLTEPLTSVQMQIDIMSSIRQNKRLQAGLWTVV
jgi:hypothetical protein